MEYSLKQLRKLLDDKKIGARELTEKYLKRAKSYRGNAFISITEEEAFANAETAQKIINSGKSEALTGIPCSIKDNISITDIKTTCGSKMLEKFTPFYDAELIKILKSQGYVLIGKTNLDEFAMGNSNRTSNFGNVANPYDAERVAGGSSGGSAVAVAADLCAYSIGTDTGGSVRQPSAHCGITGLKPTYGRISRYGVTAFSGSFDTVGPMAKSAEDCAIVLGALCGNIDENFDCKIGQSVKGLKIALVKELFTESVNKNVRNAVIAAVDFLKSQGAEVVEVSMPVLGLAAPAYFAISSAEAASALARFDGVKYGLQGDGTTYDEQLRDSRTRGFGDEVKRRVLLGNFVLSGENIDTYFRKALSVKQRVKADFDELFRKADVVISPTSMRTAFDISEPSDFVKIYSSTLYTVPANLAGLPSISTPCNISTKYSRENMPIGMSIMGRKFDEATILQVADCVERGYRQ